MGLLKMTREKILKLSQESEGKIYGFSFLSLGFMK
jgi:hypothetical protein